MNKQRDFFLYLSATLVLLGAVLYLSHWFYVPYIFAVGAAGVALVFLTTPTANLDFRQKRLHRINVFAGISLVASSVFMFRGETSWVVFLLIAALLMFYGTLRK
ncbi:MAG: hypothetical protein LBD53_04285 [Tannerella sp.]|jgi:hypothetical protein|nr:hypothetical protein [Tannerella sp.]